MARPVRLEQLTAEQNAIWQIVQEEGQFTFTCPSPEMAKIARSRVYQLAASMKTYGDEKQRAVTLSVVLEGNSVTVIGSDDLSPAERYMAAKTEILAFEKEFLERMVAEGVDPNGAWPSKYSIELYQATEEIRRKHRVGV